MKYLLDTNVPYDLVDGTLNAIKFFNHFRSDDLYVSPLNFMEIITSTKHPFSAKKCVARQLLKFEMLPNTNEVLKEQLTGIKAEGKDTSTIISNIRVYSETSDETSLESYINEIRDDRLRAYKGFKDEVRVVIDKLYSFYGGREKLEMVKYQTLFDDLPQLFNYEIIYTTLKCRYCDIFGKNGVSSFPETLPDNLYLYANAYYAYLLRIAVLRKSNGSKYTPMFNDFGDLEQLIYYGLYFEKFMTSDGMIGQVLDNILGSDTVIKPRELLRSV
ncbi:hypothetical protein KAU45_09790 [bacterium]|nr:hypothetical protein [bacterium]